MTPFQSRTTLSFYILSIQTQRLLILKRQFKTSLRNVKLSHNVVAVLTFLLVTCDLNNLYYDRSKTVPWFALWVLFMDDRNTALSECQAGF